MKSTPFSVIFDNGGGVTIQHPAYVHFYSDHDGPEQAAQDTKKLLSGADPGDWEGHEPEHLVEYDQQSVSRGDYRWIDLIEIAFVLEGGELPEDYSGWLNVEEFFEALRMIS